MSVGMRGLYFKVVNFISLVHFYNKVNNNGILILRRVCEKIYFQQDSIQVGYVPPA